MGGLKIALAVLASVSSGSALADQVDRWSVEIARASARFDVPESWIRRVIRIESNGEQLRHGRPILSRAGAMGLMQLMPATWHDMRSALGLGPDPHDPASNILAGTLYLRLMYDRFGYPGLFGAYNAGPTRYAAYLTGAHALPSETRAYLAATAAREPARARETGTLFVVTTLGAIGRRTASRSLFVALSGSQSR